MAKKEQELTASMIDTFREFKETKNIDRTTLVSVLEESFRNVLARIFGSDENFDVIVNPDKGDFEIYRNRVVVADGEVEDENKEITLTEARKIEPDYEVGEDVSEKVDFNKFGRRAILTLRQTLASKILELEHDSLYNKYKDRVGQVISGEVYQVWKREVLIVDDENNELMLPKTEQIPGDMYRKGETVRAVILRVDNDNNNPKIILSRTAPIFLQRLLEAEVPEIADGLVAIRRIARLPGERAKIAVESFDERIDPVGACVGVKGSRVHGIVRELCNENLDVINAVIANQPDDLVINTHVCRGNFHSTWLSSGGYAPVAAKLFGEENVDAYYLEFDDDRSGDFAPLAEVSGDKKVVLGLITSKKPDLEDPDTIKARIQEAAQYIPLDRLCLSTQCGFASTQEGNKLTEDQQWAKIALVQSIAKDVWGE